MLTKSTLFFRLKNLQSQKEFPNNGFVQAKHSFFSNESSITQSPILRPLSKTESNTKSVSNLPFIGAPAHHDVIIPNSPCPISTFSDTDESIVKILPFTLTKKSFPDYVKFYPPSCVEEEKEKGSSTDVENANKRKMWIQQLQNSFRRHEMKRLQSMLQLEEKNELLALPFSDQSTFDTEKELDQISSSSTEIEESQSHCTSNSIRGLLELSEVNVSPEKWMDTNLKTFETMQGNNVHSNHIHKFTELKDDSNKDVSFSTLTGHSVEEGETHKGIFEIRSIDYDADLDDEDSITLLTGLHLSKKSPSIDQMSILDSKKTYTSDSMNK